MVTKQDFLQLMENIFIGAQIEGKSGYVNLMNTRAKFYENIVLELLDGAITQYMKQVKKKFPEEKNMENALFDNLYTFYSRYLDGYAVYYNNVNPSNPAIVTPYKKQLTLTGIDVSKHIYEIFDSTNDVVLFWKTKDLYYVKTDKVWRSLDIEIEEDGETLIFSFDVSALEHKKNNEKIDSLKYEFIKKDGNRVYLRVIKGKDSKSMMKNIIKGITGRQNDHKIEEIVKKAIRKFEMQNEVDYFIHKHAKEFLDSELRLFIADNLSKGSPMSDILDEKGLFIWQWTRYIGKLVNYLIGVFEDELVKIWNKPRFVKNSHYVVTLDRIWKQDGGKEVVKEIVEYLKSQISCFREEVEKIGDLGKKIRERNERALEVGYSSLLTDWYVLEIIDKNFTPDEIIIQNANMLKDEELNEKWQFLPVDTKFLPDELEYKILSLFGNLDDALDGWLIHSENYQALNTILPKWREKVQTIYIDPPFNLEKNADFLYSVDYKDSTWITMLENRIALARDLINEKGSMFVRCDYNGNMYVRMLMNEIFGEENFRNEIVVNRKREFFKNQKNLKQFIVDYDSIYWFSKYHRANFYREIYKAKDKISWNPPFFPARKEGEDKEYRILQGKKYYPPSGRKWGVSQEDLEQLWNKGLVKVKNGKLYIGNVKSLINNNWSDIQGYASSSSIWGFSTENSEVLLKRVIQSTSTPGDLVLDFFLGSGTTTAVAHKLRRKWIGIEMGEHFYTVDLPRMKKVLFYDKSGISKDKDVKEHYNEKNAGGFFKYYSLEQFSDILERLTYNPDLLLPELDPTLMKSKDINEEWHLLKEHHIFKYQDHLTGYVRKEEEGIRFVLCDSKVNSHCEEHIEKIDYAETISNLLGLKIRRIEKDRFVLDDGTDEGLIIELPISTDIYHKLRLDRLVDWE